MKATARSINWPLVALITEGFLSRLSFGLISFALPLYAYHLGMKLTEIGILSSVNLVAALALKPVMGWLADRFGFKRSFTAAAGLRSLVSLLLALARSPWQLFAIRSVYGVSQSLRDPALNALLAEHGGEKGIASAFGWYSTAKSVAGSLGSAVAGILLTLTGSNFSLVFAVAFLLSVLPLFVVRRYVQEHSTRRDPATDGDATSPAAPPIQDIPAPATSPRTSRRDVVSYVGLGVLISGTAQMLRGLLPILATQYAHLTEAQTGVIYTVSSLVVIVSGPLFGWLSDNVSQTLVLTVRSIANTVSSLFFVAFPNLLGISVGKAVDDLGKAAFKPAWGALMTDVSRLDRKRRGQTIGWMSTAEDAGEIGGPILAGLIWNTWGIPTVMGVRVLLAIGTEVYTSILMASLKRRRELELHRMPMRLPDDGRDGLGEDGKPVLDRCSATSAPG